MYTMGREKKLDWKPSKCTIVVLETEDIQRQFLLENQPVPIRTYATFLGLSI